MSIDWQKNCKDAMWAMFWLGADKDTYEEDKAALKENVAWLIRMTTQKNAGQRGTKDCIDWNCLEHTMMTIVCAATKLALAGEFGDMPEVIDDG